MAQYKKTVVTQNTSRNRNVNSTRDASSSQTIEYTIYFLFGVLEVLLLFRLVLKFMGAGITSGFVNFIYNITNLFTLPFEGIFRRGVNEGLETTSILEPATIVAIIVYAVVAWGIVMLVRILSGKNQG